MPYIKAESRELLDGPIETLTDRISISFVGWLGGLNYTLTRIILGVIDKKGGLSYARIAMLTGVLENIKQEFYERLGSEYEVNKLVENGDVPEYKKMAKGLIKE